MKSYSASDKMKHELVNAGFKIHRKCDEQARDILDEARASEELSLKGDNEKDPLRTHLVEKIFSLIVEGSIPENTKLKVAILNDSSLCKRKEVETPSL